MRIEEDIIDSVLDALDMTDARNGITTSIADSIKGKIYSQGDRDTDTEDIVVSKLSTLNGTFQESFVNLNLYVPCLRKGNGYIKDRKRISELSKLIVSMLDGCTLSDCLIRVQSDSLFELDNEYLKNFKLIVTHLNYQ